MNPLRVIDDVDGISGNIDYPGERIGAELCPVTTANGEGVGPKGRGAKVLLAAGFLALIAGAVDPMEGAAVVLVGSGLAATGATLGGIGRRAVVFRWTAFVLILVGAAALWGLSAAGGIGGGSGRSLMWGVLVVPFLAGWSMSVWGPGSPRWVVILGMLVSAWYVAIFVLVLRRAGGGSGGLSLAPGIALGVVGIATMAGGLHRLLQLKGVSPNY